ncbi:MAG: DegQ family serine endoprotease [Desulfobacteraceae bacterium]|nr:DegQ family serine endoprotease [Desulfobacteraceae bacterium]
MARSAPFRPKTGSWPLFFCLLLAALWSAASAGTAAAVSSPPASFADLAEKLEPTVVNIYTTQTIKIPSSPHDFFFNEPDQIPEMFRHFGMPGMPDHAFPREQTRTSLGSGVITTADGYIITNNHMVEGADEINIKLADAEEYQAKVIGRDPKTDLALLKIAPKHPLQFATFGDSDQLRVGDWVIAIGNPFGFEQTVTAGIVSGKGRVIGGGPYDNFIQTDASINPGNSGGPLFNMDGKMVGVNTAIYSRGGGNIGIGFAIPVNMVRGIMQQLKEHGKVVRGWLGVMVQQVTPELAEQFGLDRPIGALVAGVSPNSPGAAAGLKPGDVIIQFGNAQITQMNMLPAQVAQTSPGAKVKITFIRNGKRMQTTATVQELREKETAGGHGKAKEELGLAVQDLTPEMARSLGIGQTTGVLVAEVEPGSPAAESGLRPGDLILEVNRRKVDDVAAFRETMGRVASGRTVLFLIKRDANTLFVAMRKK